MAGKVQVEVVYQLERRLNFMDGKPGFVLSCQISNGKIEAVHGVGDSGRRWTKKAVIDWFRDYGKGPSLEVLTLLVEALAITDPSLGWLEIPAETP